MQELLFERHGKKDLKSILWEIVSKVKMRLGNYNTMKNGICFSVLWFKFHWKKLSRNSIFSDWKRPMMCWMNWKRFARTMHATLRELSRSGFLSRILPVSSFGCFLSWLKFYYTVKDNNRKIEDTVRCQNKCTQKWKSWQDLEKGNLLT